jgi:hypothetical protein
MFGLSYLFYPWGYIVQIVALVHFFRRRPEGYWLLIIFLGGFIGSAVYIIAEVIPDAGLLRGTVRGFGRKSRIRQIQAAIVDNPSAANFEELGELYWDQKEYAPAREAFDRAIATRSDSPHMFYRRALCAFELGDYPAAIADLEPLLRTDAKFDHYRAAAVLARAYGSIGRKEEALALYAQAVQYLTTPEDLYRYAAFLESQDRREEARQWAMQLMEKKRTLPRYMQRIERPWFRKGKSLLKALSARA